MHDDNQILVPPSFIALYSDARQRLLTPVHELRARYELCEDLAQHLVEQAQQLYHGGARSEEGVLQGIHAGLAGSDADGDPAADVGVTAAEARWITLRLAELLQWRSPELPPQSP